MKRIGVFCWQEKRYGRVAIEINNMFMDGVDRAGAIPLVFPSVLKSYKLLDEFLSLVDGVIMTGGADVSPFLYGQEPIRELAEIQPHRDTSEIQIIQRIFDRKIPLLAVCRGMQLVNAYFGGSLYQDIYVQRENTLVHSPKIKGFEENFHKLFVEKGSHLYQVLGQETIVNSFHHQAIKELAPQFKVVARSSDGIIEGIEPLVCDHFFMGIQFHPEFTHHSDKFDEIFDYFVKGA